jgi:hypothetical protein
MAAVAHFGRDEVDRVVAIPVLEAMLTVEELLLGVGALSEMSVHFILTKTAWSLKRPRRGWFEI